MRRVVVVGLGSIGRRHVRLLRERPDVQVEVVEPNAAALERARNESGDLRAHPDYRSALESTPDVVWIATPTPLHAEQSIAAVRAGAHVFCEKPMSHSVASAREMKRAADAASTMFNVGFYLHFWEGMVRIRKLIETGALGRVLHMHAHVGSYTTLVNSASRYQATQPGSLFFDYSHQPDLFYWLLNRAPQSVWVAGFQGGDLELRSAPNIIDLICEYGGDLLSTVHLNYVQTPERHSYEIIGDRGWVQADFFGSWIRFGSDTETFTQTRDDIFRAEHAAFFDTIDGKRAPETSAADGLVSTAICEAAVASWRSGARVELQRT